MTDGNGLTVMLEALREHAKDIQGDVSLQMILAAVLASREERRQESAAFRQRFRWLTRTSVSALVVASISVLFDVALHGEAEWAVNLLRILRP